MLASGASDFWISVWRTLLLKAHMMGAHSQPASQILMDLNIECYKTRENLGQASYRAPLIPRLWEQVCKIYDTSFGDVLNNQLCILS